MPLNCVCCKAEWQVRGDKQTHARAFPGTNKAQKVYPEKVCAHASSRPVVEEGANAHPGKAAGKHENAGTHIQQPSTIILQVIHNLVVLFYTYPTT